MLTPRFFRSLWVTAGLTLTALVGVGTAQARDVNWAVGFSAPGVVVGVDNDRAVRVAPAPVYYDAPRPQVYYAPPPPPRYAVPVYVAPPVVGSRYRDPREDREYYHPRHRHHHDREYRDYDHDRSSWYRR